LSVTSKRDVKRNEAIKFITKFGRPLVIATDVTPTPKSIEKLASKLGCKIYSPEYPLSLLEKQELTREFRERVKGGHEIDALAASIKAWKNYRDLFSKVSHTLEKLNLPDIFEDVVIKLIKEDRYNIDDAIKEILDQKKKPLPETPEKRKTIQDYEKLVEELQKKLAQRDENIRVLTEQANSLNKALIRIKSELRRFEKIKIDSRKFDRLRDELCKLKETIEKLKKFRRLESMDYTPLIEIESVSGTVLEELDNKIGLENSVLFSHSTENLNLLNRFRIKALVTKELPKEDALENLEYPIVLVNEKQIQTIEGVKVIKKDVLEKELAAARKTGLVEWLKSYKEREF
jgi:predicted RNase H-like nuclease (RuvC/YqgF family)